MLAVTPESDEVQVGGIQHQFDADQDDDGVAARQRPCQTDAEEQCGEQQITRERRHSDRKLQAPSSKLQRMSKSQIRGTRDSPLFGVWIFGFLWSLEFGVWSFISLPSSR